MVAATVAAVAAVCSYVLLCLPLFVVAAAANAGHLGVSMHACLLLSAAGIAAQALVAPARACNNIVSVALVFGFRSGVVRRAGACAPFNIVSGCWYSCCCCWYCRCCCGLVSVAGIAVVVDHAI